MNELFLKIINMSISASWLVLAVLLLRLLFKKAPKWVNVLLWGIVAVRLICPFSFESALSLIPSAETISPTIMMDQTPSVYTGIPVINSVINPVIGQSFAPAPGASANPLQIWIPILGMIWIIGVAVLLLYTAVSYWRLRGKVSEAVILRDNIYQSENVGSPFVLGIIKPKVYLPYKMDVQDLGHVVAHEQAHIRRKDHWWKPLGFLLLTIHWFNPLMWLAYVLLCRDIELACDEKVIKELGNEQRADYTQALVACSVNRRMIAACPLAFGEVSVKERVKSVMNYKKPAFWVIVPAVIACVVVAVCFLTNPIGFEFDEASHTIVSANHFDMRAADDAVTVEMNPAQISELSSRLAGVKNTKKSEEYCGWTPGYQISALLEDGTYIRISGYDLSDNDMVDIEWNGERYVVSDVEFQDYLSRICGGSDVSSADNNVIADHQENIETEDTGNAMIENHPITEDNEVLSEVIDNEDVPFVPTETDVLELRAMVLEGMSESEIFRLTDFIKATNLKFERAWFYNDIFGQLSDPENVYWTYFDRTGEIQIGWAESDGETSAVIAYNDHDAAFFITTISELKENIVSGMLNDDLDKLIDLCAKAEETHDVEYAVEMYRMLHDLDYFLLRYGPVDVGKYVTDDSTISKYYGSLSIWKAYE